MVTVSDSQQVEGRNGIRFQVDQSLREIDASALDMVFLTGGPGVLPIKNTLIIEIVQPCDRGFKFVAAISTVPKFLAQAAIFENRPATINSSFRSKSPIAVRTESSSPPTQ